MHTKFNGVPYNQIISYVFDGKCTQDELEQYSKLKEKYYRQFCTEDKANFYLVSGVENYYNELKSKGIPFTIASASIKENIYFFIESFCLD